MCIRDSVITVVVFAIYIANIKDAYKHQLLVAAGKKPTSLRTEDVYKRQLMMRRSSF